MVPNVSTWSQMVSNSPQRSSVVSRINTFQMIPNDSNVIVTCRENTCTRIFLSMVTTYMTQTLTQSSAFSTSCFVFFQFQYSVSMPPPKGPQSWYWVLIFQIMIKILSKFMEPLFKSLTWPPLNYLFQPCKGHI